MTSFGNRIKSLRNEQGLTQVQLADKLGVSKSTISMYENENRYPEFEAMENIADFFNVDMDYLYCKSDIKNRYQHFGLSEFDNLRPISTKKIPLLGKVACGEPTYAEEDRESYIEIGTDLRADFCLIAKGDSMIGARIQDGDVVFIKAQDMVENGEIAVVIIDDEVTLKRVFYQNGKRIILQAENSAIPALVYEGETLDQVRIIGKAIAFQSDVN